MKEASRRSFEEVLKEGFKKGGFSFLTKGDFEKGSFVSWLDFCALGRKDSQGDYGMIGTEHLSKKPTPHLF